MKAGSIFKILRDRDIHFALSAKGALIVQAPEKILTRNVRAFIRGRQEMIIRILQYQTMDDLADLKSKYNALLKKHQECAWILDTVGFPDCETMVEHELEKMTAIELTHLAARIKIVGGQPMDGREWLEGFRDFHTDEELILELEKYFGELQEIADHSVEETSEHLTQNTEH